MDPFTVGILVTCGLILINVAVAVVVERSHHKVLSVDDQVKPQSSKNASTSKDDPDNPTRRLIRPQDPKYNYTNLQGSISTILNTMKGYENLSHTTERHDSDNEINQQNINNSDDIPLINKSVTDSQNVSESDINSSQTMEEDTNLPQTAESDTNSKHTSLSDISLIKTNEILTHTNESNTSSPCTIESDTSSQHIKGNSTSLTPNIKKDTNTTQILESDTSSQHNSESDINPALNIKSNANTTPITESYINPTQDIKTCPSPKQTPEGDTTSPDTIVGDITPNISEDDTISSSTTE
ncbi:clumping factor A-like [Portunus trituberculatus]|uniref:clumping factor A-like n=1 Tax=Portunus trituberculatus TaxID=210409 RepID=UPI001E1CB20E|nr:clumping factor A-like [Portunus trituberculatus]